MYSPAKMFGLFVKNNNKNKNILTIQNHNNYSRSGLMFILIESSSCLHIFLYQRNTIPAF